jgi:hypothetical protein
MGASLPGPRWAKDSIISAQDLAGYLDVPLKTVYMWRHRKVGPLGFRAGRHLRFRWIDVQDWISEQVDMADRIRQNGDL